MTNTSEVLPTFAKSTKFVIRIQEAARDWMVHSGKNLKRVKKKIFCRNLREGGWSVLERVKFGLMVYIRKMPVGFDGLYWKDPSCS